ncbi:MAG: hypothetical protein NC115_10520 [Bacteroidales bacterium]|nr:hypothetical protein [Bacteroides sp.]MCM1199349.1 hypothetical protein [Clostridium sp.]MCM1503081.1 hypothetical protein [Bacteroidales bacterium]
MKKIFVILTMLSIAAASCSQKKFKKGEKTENMIIVIDPGFQAIADSCLREGLGKNMDIAETCIAIQ